MKLKDFIVLLREMQRTGNELFGVVKYPIMLFAALEELCSMIGIKEVKDDIVVLIQVLVILRIRKIKPSKSDRLMHTMLLGDPGTGKTTLGSILAKVFASLNILKIPDELPPVEGDCANPIPRVIDNNITLELRNQLRAKEEELSRIQTGLRDHQDYTLKMLSDLREYRQSLCKRNVNTNDIDYYMRELQTLKSKIDPQSRTPLENKSGPIRRTHVPKKINPYPLPPPPPPLLPTYMLSFPIQVKEPDPIFKIGYRADLIGKYLGHTAQKTRKFLNSAMGGIAFIDEAYDLFQSGYSDGDPYGGEALTVIVDYMTRFNDNIVIILGGYEKAMKRTILQGQEGLVSRIGNAYSIKPYTISELVDIFLIQMKRNEWETDCTPARLVEMFSQHKDRIINGRNTQNLVSKCIDAHGILSFDKALKGEPILFRLTEEMITMGLESFIRNSRSLTDESSIPPDGIYI